MSSKTVLILKKINQKSKKGGGGLKYYEDPGLLRTTFLPHPNVGFSKTELNMEILDLKTIRRDHPLKTLICHYIQAAQLVIFNYCFSSLPFASFTENKTASLVTRWVCMRVLHLWSFDFLHMLFIREQVPVSTECIPLRRVDIQREVFQNGRREKRFGMGNIHEQSRSLWYVPRSHWYEHTIHIKER